MIANAMIDAAIQDLGEQGLDVRREEEAGYVVLMIDRYRLPPGWSQRESRLLVKLPPSFPSGKPDMFWTDDTLTLAEGREPQQATTFETICGQRWRRFSWHPHIWTPGHDDLRTYLEFVSRRFMMRN